MIRMLVCLLEIFLSVGDISCNCFPNALLRPAISMVRSFMGARRLLDICQRYCNRDLWSLHIICALRENQCIEIYLLLCKNMQKYVFPAKNTTEKYKWELRLRNTVPTLLHSPWRHLVQIQVFADWLLSFFEFAFFVKTFPTTVWLSTLVFATIVRTFLSPQKRIVFLNQSSSPPTVSSKVWFKAQLEHNFHTVSFYSVFVLYICICFGSHFCVYVSTARNDSHRD